MATFNSLFVRLPDVADDVSAIGQFVPPDTKFEVNPSSEYVQFPRISLERPSTEMESWSSGLSDDVLWIFYQSVADAFEFQHWESGVCVRRLVYGCAAERTWEQIEGEEEPWEDEVTGITRVGDSFRFDPRDAVHAIAEYYELWEDD